MFLRISSAYLHGNQTAQHSVGGSRLFPTLFVDHAHTGQVGGFPRKLGTTELVELMSVYIGTHIGGVWRWMRGIGVNTVY